MVTTHANFMILFQYHRCVTVESDINNVVHEIPHTLQWCLGGLTLTRTQTLNTLVLRQSSTHPHIPRRWYHLVVFSEYLQKCSLTSLKNATLHAQQGGTFKCFGEKHRILNLFSLNWGLISVTVIKWNTMLMALFQ